MCGFRRGRYYFWRVLGSEVVEWSVQLATLQSLMLTTTINYMTVTLVMLILNTISTPWGFLMRGRGAFMREVIVFIDTVGDFFFVIINSVYLNTDAKLRAEADLFRFIKIPAVTTGLVWPCFLIWLRSRGLCTAFLRNYSDPNFATAAQLTMETNARNI